MATLRYQTPLPGFMVRQRLQELGLLAGAGAVDHGMFRVPPGAWLLLDLGRGLVEITMADDDVEAAMVVIPEVITDAFLEVVG